VFGVALEASSPDGMIVDSDERSSSCNQIPRVIGKDGEKKGSLCMLETCGWKLARTRLTGANRFFDEAAMTSPTSLVHDFVVCVPWGVPLLLTRLISAAGVSGQRVEHRPMISCCRLD
jgi:hypothetical protein